MSNLGSSTKKVFKEKFSSPKKATKSIASIFTLGIASSQTLFGKDVIDKGFEAPPGIKGEKALTTEQRRQRQIFKSREEILQQRRRAPGRTQTILTRRDG